MKSFKKIFILLIIPIVLLGCSFKNSRLSPGKDTEGIFNDRYTIDLINHFSSEYESELESESKWVKSEWILIDRFPKESPTSQKTIEENNVIEKEISAFYDEKPFLYIIGYSGYSKFNYETGEILQSEDISSFANDDKIIFNEMTNNNLKNAHYKETKKE